MRGVLDRLSVSDNERLRRLVTMAGPRLDRVGNVAVLLDDDHIYVAFHISYQLFDMHAYAARAAVLKDHDRAAMRAFKKGLERVERFNIQKCCGHYGSILRRAKPRENLAVGNKIRCS